ncbi:MAG: Rrf2 family transcriptional regulator [Bacteroidales bacterium]|nr:Rrf2 family transcriptional regulator [Bacteroidales bacterium]HQP03979.1 Rrf2 family transcriptional regulator [Bacteroidales bacterium]
MSKVIAISEAAGIALHSMVLIARSENSINATEIANISESSRHHVAKILQRLVKSGLISSVRGPSGGFRLKKSADIITLLEIYEAIEGKIALTSCPFDHEKCVMGKCILQQIANKVSDDFVRYLSETHLNTVL